MATMKEIEALTLKFSAAHEALAGAVMAHEEEKRELARRNLTRIRRLIESAKERRDVLAEAIGASPECFIKPRTVIFHGVRIGIMKSKDLIEYDPDQAVKLIRKHLEEDDFDRLVKTSYKPINDALSALPESIRKKLGVNVLPGRDEILIKPTAGEVEKLVAALIKDAPEEVEA